MNYEIGGHNFCVNLYQGDDNLDRIMPSFLSFKAEEVKCPLFTLDILERLEEVPEAECRISRDVDTGNGIIRLSKLIGGGYQFQISDVNDTKCALLIADADFAKCKCMLNGSVTEARYAANNVVMLVYAFRSSFYDTLLVHASVVRHNGVAYAFTAQSGTGKSTHVANWMRAVSGCDIINDDNPVIRLINGKPILYGSPWSGKTPCYRNVSAPLGALMLIKRDERNYVVLQKPIAAFTTVLTACSSMKWDETLYQNVCETSSKLVESVPITEMHCLPDVESALVCREYLDGI